MAENVVDSMVVNVRLDSKPFKRGQRDVERGIESISKAAVSMFAIFAGGKGLKSFLSDINQTEQNLYFLSKNLDTNATSLQAWGRAVERTGGTAEGLQSTLAGLTRATAEYMTTGQTGAMGVFNQLGIKFGNAEDMLERIRDVLTPIAEAGDRQRANLLGNMMGIDQGTLNAMFEGRKEFDAILKAQRENARMTKASTERAQRLAEAFKDVKFEAENAGLELLETLNPALQKSAKWLVENKDNVIQLAEALGTVLLVTMGITAAKFVAKAGPIGIISAGIFALWNDFDNFRDGNDHLIDWDKWGKEAEKGSKDIKDYVHSLTESVKSSIKSIDDAVKNSAFLTSLTEAWPKMLSDLVDLLELLSGRKSFNQFGRMLGSGAYDFTEWFGENRQHDANVFEDARKDNAGVYIGNKVGEAVAKFFAHFGSKSAQYALDMNGDSLILDTIRKAEGSDYNAYNKGKAGDSKNGPRLDLENMTVGEIMRLHAAHKADKALGIFAAGEGQWIPDTFKELVKKLGIDKHIKFGKEFQDALMLETIPPYVMDYWAGKHNDLNGALHRMSGKWAGFPDPLRGGKSYHEGVGNNHANISMEEAMRMMQYGRAHYSDIQQQMQGNEIIIHGGINVTVPPGSDGAAVGRGAYDAFTHLVRKGDGGGAH